jgi:hypothetical protein
VGTGPTCYLFSEISRLVIAIVSEVFRKPAASAERLICLGIAVAL